jgi:transglutaminase-like putative cysteine protease
VFRPIDTTRPVTATARTTKAPASTAIRAATATRAPTHTPTATPPPTSSVTPTRSATPTPTVVPTSDTARRYEMTYEIERPTVLGQKQLVEQLWLPLPNTDGGGTTAFRLIEAYPRPYELLDLGEANQALYWKEVPQLCQQTDCRFGVRFEVTLDRPMYAIPWQTAVSYDTAGELYRTYTRPERGIESDDPKIRELAQRIVGGEANVYKRVLQIQAWVHENVRYPSLGSTYPDDAALCIDKAVGDCAGQSKVFVSLCRALGIPARTISGLLPYKLGVGQLSEFGSRAAWFDQNLSVHVWVEVYLPQLGWVQGEPDVPGFGEDKERLITRRGPFELPDGLCRQATYFHLPLAVRGDWCGQSVGQEVSIDAHLIQ